MRHRHALSLFFVLLPFMPVDAAQAGLFRAYLSVNGNDANPCTVQQPCRLLPAALAAINDGGEIWVLDSANFNTGTVTISKSVSIVALPGQVASFVAIGFTSALSIDAAGATVSLRGLRVGTTGGSGLAGIDVVNAAHVRVDQCTVERFQWGIRLTSGGTLTVKDSMLGANTYGLDVEVGSSATVAVDHVAFDGNAGAAVWAVPGTGTGSLRMTIDNSEINGVTNSSGVIVQEANASSIPAYVAIKRTKIAGNGTWGPGYATDGVTAGGLNVRVTLSDTFITGWTYGATPTTGYSGVGTMRSLGNNTIVDNVNNAFVTPVSAL